MHMCVCVPEFVVVILVTRKLEQPKQPPRCIQLLWRSSNPEIGSNLRVPDGLCAPHSALKSGRL